MAMVLAGIPVVDAIHPRANIQLRLEPGQHAATKDQRVTCYGTD